MLEQREHVEEIRWHPFKNESGETVPAWAVLYVQGIDGATGLYSVGQPQVDGMTIGSAMFNGPAAVPAGGYGSCTRDWPATALYDPNDGEPVAGQIWGTGAFQWALRLGQPGFEIQGGVSAEDSRVQVLAADAGGSNAVRPVFVTGPAVAGYSPARIDRRNENLPGWVPVEPAEIVWAIGYNNDTLTANRRYKGLLVSVNPNDGVPVYSCTQSSSGGGTFPAASVQVQGRNGQTIGAPGVDVLEYDAALWDTHGFFDNGRPRVLTFPVLQEDAYYQVNVFVNVIDSSGSPKNALVLSIDHQDNDDFPNPIFQVSFPSATCFIEFPFQGGLSGVLSHTLKVPANEGLFLRVPVVRLNETGQPIAGTLTYSRVSVCRVR